MGYQDEEFSQYPVHIRLLKEAHKESVAEGKKLSYPRFQEFTYYNASINFEGDDGMLENAIVRLKATGYPIDEKESLEKISTIYILADDGETIFEFIKGDKK